MHINIKTNLLEFRYKLKNKYKFINIFISTFFNIKLNFMVYKYKNFLTKNIVYMFLKIKNKKMSINVLDLNKKIIMYLPNSTIIKKLKLVSDSGNKFKLYKNKIFIIINFLKILIKFLNFSTI